MLFDLNSSHGTCKTGPVVKTLPVGDFRVISIGFYDGYFSKLTVNLSNLNSSNFNKIIKTEKKIIARLKKNIRKHNTKVKLNLRKFSNLLKD